MHKTVFHLFLTLTAISYVSAETPDDVLTAAYLSASSGDTLSAIVILESACFPENYSFLINAGYMLFEWNLFENALEMYEQAVAISGNGTDAVLGVAWSDYYLGNGCEAWNGFREVLSCSPGNLSAKQGIEMCHANAPGTSLTAYGGWMNYSSDFYRDSAFGLTTDVTLSIGLGNLLRYVHRETEFSVKTPEELGFAEDDSTDIMEQTENWVSWEWTLPCGNMSFTGGVIENDSRWNEGSSIMSLGLEFRRFGLIASQSCYSDGTYRQYDLYWIYIPADVIDTKITLSVQDAHNAALISGRLGASYYLNNWTVSASIRGGRESRAVYPGIPSVSNVPQETRAAAEIGVNRELFGYGNAFIAAGYQYLHDPGGEIWDYEDEVYTDRPEQDGEMFIISFGINLKL